MEGIRRVGIILRIFGLVVSTELRTVAFDQCGTELLEVLGMGARISVDILELGRFPSW